MEAACYRAIVGARGDTGVPTPEEFTALYPDVGPAEAHRTFGVSTSTWKRWRNGEVKRFARGKPKSAIEKAIRRARLSPTREKKIRAAGKPDTKGTPLVLKGASVWVSKKKEADKARTTVQVGASLADDLNCNALIVDAFLSGVPGAMADAIHYVVSEYVTGMQIDSLDSIILL